MITCNAYLDMLIYPNANFFFVFTFSPAVISVIRLFFSKTLRQGNITKSAPYVTLRFDRLYSQNKRLFCMLIILFLSLTLLSIFYLTLVLR
ncbi:hypothetical protein L9F63_009731, partial [Diploptera punctata]